MSPANCSGSGGSGTGSCLTFTPTVAVANHLACKGLDRIERTLPILQRPPEQVRAGPPLPSSGSA